MKAVSKSEEHTEQSFEAIRVGGVEVNYYLICKRKLWWYAHDLGMEKSSDRVLLGKLMHEESYARKRKEYLIDDLVRIDFIEDETVHEVKLSKAMEEAHVYQLLYYLYFLKQRGVEVRRGMINYPRSKRQMEVELTPEREREIEEILKGIGATVRLPAPPNVEWMSICRKCAYAELCWA